MLPLTFVAQYEKLYVRPEHPATAKAMTFRGEAANRDAIADWGILPQDLGHGFLTNQQLVMPFYQAYQEVRKSIRSRSTKGPVETLRYGLPTHSSDWNEVIFVSEKQVIEELATGSLTKEIRTKFIANSTQ